MKFYTRMEHLITSEKMTLTVFRLLFVNRFLEEIHFELPSLKMFIKSVLIFFTNSSLIVLKILFL